MNDQWWGEFEFETGETRLWRLGGLSLWVTRTPSEFRMARLQTNEDDGVFGGGGCTDEQPPEAAEITRYGVERDDRVLHLLPATADRPLIVKSDPTFIVPPGGETTAFISSPASLTLMLGPGRPLAEETSRRLSDTWFGPSTITGELCYAIRSSVRFDLANLPVRPHRIYSVVRIQNHAGTPLPLARLRLPLPHLCLYAGRSGRLWTESVILDRTGDDDLAEIKLGESAPHQAGEAQRVVGPRVQPHRKHLIRSFTGLFGHSEVRGYERVVE